MTTINYTIKFSSVAQSCPTLCDPMNHSMPGLPVHHQLPSLLRLIPSSWLRHPTISSSVVPFSSCLQSLPESGSFPMSQLFAWGQSIGVSFSFSISPSNEYPGLISFRMDWLDLLAIQGILKSLLQHHSSKASILRCSAFFTVQLSHPYMTTGKTIALTRWTFVGKVMSLLFNMLSKFVIVFHKQWCLSFANILKKRLRGDFYFAGHEGVIVYRLLSHRTSLVVHGLRFCASTAGGTSLIPSQRSSAYLTVWPNIEKKKREITLPL